MHVSIHGAGGATIDHAEIRRWIEERGGKPTIGTNSKLGIQFDNVQKGTVAWGTFFETFENRNQLFVYQEKFPDGSVSSFFKFTNR